MDIQARIERHWKAIRQYAASQIGRNESSVGSANDVAQDAAVRMLEGPYKDEGTMRFIGWMKNSVKWTIYDKRKSVRAMRNDPGKMAGAEIALDQLVSATTRRHKRAKSPLTLAELEEHRGLVLRALESLQDPYRTILTLRYIQDLAPIEIARRRGEKPASVRSQILRGTGLLKAAMESASRGEL